MWRGAGVAYFDRRLAQLPPRRSWIVGPIQRAAAIHTPSPAYLLGPRQIDPRQAAAKTSFPVASRST